MVKMSCRYRNYYQLKFDVHVAKEGLMQFKGGSVDLIKNDKTGIATMVINNPVKKNAMTGKMMVDMDSCVKELEDWEEGRGLILRGAGGTFCSGGDLDFVKRIMTKQKGFEMTSYMHRNMSRISCLPLITVALIEGNALGGGAEIVTACDFRLMTESATIGFVQAKMGIATGWGGGTRLTKLLGRKVALHLLCSAKVLTSENAFNLDLVDEIIPDTNSEEYSKEWLLKCLGDLQPPLINVIKEITCHASDVGMELSLMREKILFSKVWCEPVHEEIMEKIIKHK